MRQLHWAVKCWRWSGLAGAILAVLSARHSRADCPTLTLDATTIPADAAAPAAAPAGLFGDWGGERARLGDSGLTVGGYVFVDVSRNFRGGLTTADTPVRYLLDLNVTFDPQALLHWQGAQFFLEFQSHDGPDASTHLTGDVIGFDNADAERFVQIYQAWYQQQLGETVRLKVGKIDGNTEFSVLEHAHEFLTATAAYSVAVFTLPTYPDAAPGGLVFWQPTEHFYLGGGLFYSNHNDTFLDISGHPAKSRPTSGGVFLIGESGARWKIAELPGHIGAGGWTHTGDFPAIDTGARLGGTSGAYFFGDQTLWHSEHNDGLRDVGVFFNYSWADPQASVIAQEATGGIAATGLIPSRPDDIGGIGAAWARLGDVGPTTNGYEAAVECFYKIVITPWASVKTDLQYINHPSGNLDDALVMTVRLELDF